MKPTICFALITTLVLICSPSFAQQNNKAENLYQEGLMQMEGRGNYQKALEIFGRIMKEFAGDRRAAAKAQFQTGVCYEKLGKAEAQKAYEQTISKYPDQTDLVAQARARLSALSAAVESGRGPVTHRLLSGTDTDDKNLYDIFPSPDGRRVAYVSVYDGSLYTRDLASGDVQHLIPEMPDIYHYSPRWSPDGKRLAVMANNYKTNVCVVKLIDVAAHTTVVVPGTESKEWREPKEWRKDDQLLLSGPKRSTLVRIDDGTVLVSLDSVSVQSLSPDRRFAVFTVGKEKNSQVFVQPVTDAKRQQITEASGGNNHPVWSPDGRAIAYAHTGGIWIVPMSNGATSGPPRLALAAPRVHLWAWSDAGLFYTQWKETDKGRILSQIEVDPSTGEAHASGIQKLPIVVPEAAVGFRWSPDMRRIAITAGEQGSQKIYVYSVDSKALTTFQIGPEGFWSHDMWWSADGKEFLFQYRNAFLILDAKFTVMALDVTSGKIRQLFPYRNDWYHFSASTDGKKMAFYRWKNDSSYIRIEGIVVAPFGQPEGQYAAVNRPGVTTLDWRGPKISPQGDKVAFARQEYPGGNASYPYDGATLWVANSDGSNTKKLATVTLVRSMAWDPSGRFIAYTGKVDSGRSAASVLRVVEIATGVERELPLKGYAQNDLQLADWSSDGRYIGISIGPHWESDAWLEEHPEFWVVQGLQDKAK
jgi:Tol biopolymer transport system component